MERDSPYNNDDHFEVIENDSPIPFVRKQYIDINGTNNLEKTIERLDRVHRRQGHCDNVRLKIEENYHFLKDLIILDNADSLEKLRISLASKAIFGKEVNSLTLPFEETANGAQKADKPYLILFTPSPNTLLTDGLNAKSIMNKGLTQRLILPVNAQGIGIGAAKLPKQPFMVFATPSIRVKDGKAGTLNLHVSTPENIDLCSVTAQTIFRMRNIADSPGPNLPRSHYTI